MTFSEAMLQTARAATDALQDQLPKVRQFVEAEHHPQGGFRNRAGDPDLYYTAFGMDCLLALGHEAPGAGQEDYLRSFGDGELLDFVHLACLARCWARVPGLRIGRRQKESWRRQLEAYRTPDGGYATVTPAITASVSASFLAAQALDDLGLVPPHPGRALAALAGLRAKDGAYANEPGLAWGTTMATAGVVILLRRLHLPVESALKDWITARCHPEGGFLAHPAAPVPDLLSTATALYALHRMRLTLDETRRRACLYFIEALMDDSGGFCAQAADTTPDCEYTFYALLALGCLAEGRCLTA